MTDIVERLYKQAEDNLDPGNALVREAAAEIERLRSALKAHSMTREWQPIATEPADGSSIWISDGERVWLSIAHQDGSLKLPSRSLCKFWMPAEIPAPQGDVK